MKKQVKKTKDNSQKQLLFAIIAVALIIGLTGGGTYAYWSWQSINGTGANSQQTNVTVTVAGANLLISGGNVNKTSDSTGMYPTNDCDGAGALVGEEATVTVVNETESTMQVRLKIRATVTSKQGTLDATNRAYLKWAIVETTPTGNTTDNKCLTAISHTKSTATCDLNSALYKGTLANVTTNTDIDTTITFEAGAAKYNTSGAAVSTPCTTTRKYKLYVWLDSGYTWTNYGSTVNDPMQDLTLSVKWSPASSMTQNPTGPAAG